MILVTSKEMREMDKKTILSFGLPSFTLMENAGKKSYEIFLKSFSNLKEKKIGVVIGKGNNGGDGFVIARYLLNNDFDVTIFLISKKTDLKGDAKKNLTLSQKLKIPIFEIDNETKFKKHKKEMSKIDIFIDAIFGTGLNSDVRGVFKNVINFINNEKKCVFSIDIPSGINSDTGKVCGFAIKSTATATFAFPKIGHIINEGNKHSGKLHIVDIGIPKYISDEVKPKHFALNFEYFKNKIKVRDDNTHKGKSGHILTFAGNIGTTGALIMVAKSALRVGAGLVSMLIPKEINTIIETNVIEGMTIPFLNDPFKVLIENSKNKNVIAIGSGLGKNKKTKTACLKFIKKTKIPIVLDADVLNFIAEEKNFSLKNLKAEKVLTPHPKEMARLINSTVNKVQKNRIDIAKEFAIKNNAHLILKGHKTIIAHPDGEIYINTSGNSGMATGGMGDVLCGMVAGFIAQGYNIKTASHIAVFLHGFAGDKLAKKKGTIGFLPTDLIEIIPNLKKSFNRTIIQRFPDTD